MQEGKEPQPDDETIRMEWNDGDGWDELERVLDTAERLDKSLLITPRTVLVDDSGAITEEGTRTTQLTWVDENAEAAPYLCVEPVKVVLQ